ncbi:hypothetical protein KDA11_05870 [Candidatus Saccharibacteria bacterium]|nr:hypothetical protein [Candidatus Saccharibacteria bacterium]
MPTTVHLFLTYHDKEEGKIFLTLRDTESIFHIPSGLRTLGWSSKETAVYAARDIVELEPVRLRLVFRTEGFWLCKYYQCLLTPDEYEKLCQEDYEWIQTPSLLTTNALLTSIGGICGFKSEALEDASDFLVRNEFVL